MPVTTVDPGGGGGGGGGGGRRRRWRRRGRFRLAAQAQQDRPGAPVGSEGREAAGRLVRLRSASGVWALALEPSTVGSPSTQTAPPISATRAADN